MRPLAVIKKVEIVLGRGREGNGWAGACVMGKELGVRREGAALDKSNLRRRQGTHRKTEVILRQNLAKKTRPFPFPKPIPPLRPPPLPLPPSRRPRPRRLRRRKRYLRPRRLLRL